jgi:hypothetical protein
MTRHFRAIALAAALLLSAPAAYAQEPSADRTETAQSADGVNLRLMQTDEPGVREEAVDASTERVYAAVTDVYAELRIPGAGSDPGRRLVAALNQRVRRVAGRGIATYFECGAGYGSQSSEYDVYITVATSVDPAPGGSRLRSAVSAHARGSAGSSSIACSSTGALEALISQRVAQRLAR